MARILLAWELGGGLGHVANLRAVGQVLEGRGHECVYAMRSPLSGLRLLGPSAEVVPAPVWTGPGAPPGFRAQTFADILATQGWQNAEALEHMHRLWSSLLRLLSPDLVVAEYAPTLCLATRGRVPTLVFGNGFCTPPSHVDRFALLRPEPGPELAEQGRILDNCNRVLATRGAAPLDRLPQFLEGESRLICSLSAFDPYAGARDETLVGPVEAMAPASPRPASPRLFAYLSCEGQHGAEILQGLRASGLPGVLVARSGHAQAERLLAGSAIEVSRRPLPFVREFPRSSVIVSHASLGTAQAALLAGRPQLTFPGDLEKSLIGRRMQDLRIGAAFPRTASPDKIVQALRALHESAQVGRALDALSAEARSQCADDVGELAAERLLALL